MKHLLRNAATFIVLVRDVLAITCTTDRALQVAESISLKAIPSCSTYLAATHTDVTGLPSRLTTFVSVASEASSVCSCLLKQSATTTTTTTATPTSLQTCPSSCKATSTITVTSSDLSTTTSTLTKISTCPTTGASTTTSISTTTTTVTQSGGGSSGGSVDQNGCPAVDGSNLDRYIIHCASAAGSGSFAASTNTGYNIQDCVSQCFDNPDGIDCLAASYTPPSSLFSIIDGHLNPGTCTFYEFVLSAIPTPGSVLAVFENTFG